MKKTMITAIMLVSAIATMLASCGIKEECDFCGEKKICKTENVWGETISLCNECLDEMNGEEDDDYYDNDSKNVFGIDEEHENDENDENEKSFDEEAREENEKSNLKEIDIFEDVESFVQYSGGNGNGYVSVNIPADYVRQIGDIYLTGNGAYDDKLLKVIYNNKCVVEFYLNYSGEGGLSEGDSITVSAKCYSSSDESYLEEIGYKIKSTSADVTVPDLGDYITEKSQITPEVYEAIKTKLADKRDPDEFCELYFTTYKPHVESERITNCFVTAVVYYDGWSYDYYVDEVYDIVIKPDGSVTLSTCNVNGHKTIEGARETLDTGKYNFELIEHNN